MSLFSNPYEIDYIDGCDAIESAFPCPDGINRIEWHNRVAALLETLNGMIPDPPECEFCLASAS